MNTTRRNFIIGMAGAAAAVNWKAFADSGDPSFLYDHISIQPFVAPVGCVYSLTVQEHDGAIVFNRKAIEVGDLNTSVDKYIVESAAKWMAENIELETPSDNPSVSVENQKDVWETNDVDVWVHPDNANQFKKHSVVAHESMPKNEAFVVYCGSSWYDRPFFFVPYVEDLLEFDLADIPKNPDALKKILTTNNITKGAFTADRGRFKKVRLAL